MVLAQWLDRFGQILAPDENYNPNPDETEARSEFWNLVAPDPNFTTASDNSASSSAKDSLQSTTKPPSFPKTPSAVPAPSSSFVPCATCVSKLCPQCCQKLNSSISTPATTKTRKTFHTPRSTTKLESQSSEINSRVVSCCSGLSVTLTSPEPVLNPLRKVIRHCTTTVELSEKAKSTFKKELLKNPSLLNDRIGEGEGCPAGYTPFMAAAHVDNLIAAEIIWDVVCNEDKVKTKVNRNDILLDTNQTGETAYHIAARMGSVKMLPFLREIYVREVGPDNMPVDLLGKTPLGSALASPAPKAWQNRAYVMESMYDKNDLSIRGNPLPADERVIQVSSLTLLAGTAEMPGKRVLMEDYTVADNSLESAAIFAVADGHSDQCKVSKFVAETLVTDLKNRIKDESLVDETSWKTICKDICLGTDSRLKKERLTGGSVAVLIAVTNKHIVVANVGDCRCILVQSEKSDDVKELTEATKNLSIDSGSNVNKKLFGKYSIVALSNDHKPGLAEEARRIENAGFSIIEETFEENGETVTIHKVNNLKNSMVAFSRSFGDFEFKDKSLEPENQAVTANPEVIVHNRIVEDSLLVAGCDGIWDVMSNDDAAKFVTGRVEFYMKDSSQVTAILPTVADELLMECLNRGSRDNMSVTIIALSKVAESLSAASGSTSWETKKQLFTP